MKLISILSLFVISLNGLSFYTTPGELNNYLKEKSKSQNFSIKKVSGEWLSTHYQAQIFPAGCGNYEENINLELYDAWKKITIYQTSGRKLEDVIMTEVVGFPLKGGVAEVKGEVFMMMGYSSGITSSFDGPGEHYCSLMDTFNKVNSAEVLMCFEPLRNFDDPCGWYSFFIKK